MSENFVDGFCLQLSSLLDPKQIREVNELLEIYTIGFDIKPITTDLTISDYQLPQAYYIYMAAKEQDGKMKPGTREQYRWCLEKMLFRLRLPLEQITVNHLRLYIHEISTNAKTGKPISKATLNQRKAIIKSFFRWLYEEEYIQKDPSVRIRSERTDSKPRTAYKDTQIEALRSKPRTAYKDTQIEALRLASTDPRTRAIIDLLTSSGIRIAECVRLNRSDIDLESRELTVFGKGEKWRTTFIDAAAVVSIRAYLATRSDDSEALFVSSKAPHKRMTAGGIRRVLHKLSDVTGIEDIIPHRFRHTTATRAVDRGMPIESVQAMLGHEEISTTLRYAHVSKEKVKRDHQTYMR